MRSAVAKYLAILSLVAAGFVLAGARGANHDIGMDVVICSGVGMTTISVGPDGKPVKHTEPCPDGSSVFVATFALPDLPKPASRLFMIVHTPASVAAAEREELSPTARGPPALA